MARAARRPAGQGSAAAGKGSAGGLAGGPARGARNDREKHATEASTVSGAARGASAAPGRRKATGDAMSLSQPLEYIQEATQAALQIDPRTLERLLKVLEPAQRIFTYGRGRSGFVARAFAVRLMHLGYSTYVVGETITAPVQKDDVVICVSGSGTTYPVVMTAELGRRQGARVVAVTADPDSEVARLAHVVIPITVPKGNGPRAKYAPLGTVFETAAWLFCDVIVAMLMERKGETEARMRQRHATLE